MTVIRSSWIGISLAAFALAGATGALIAGEPMPETDPHFRNPELRSPVHLLIPWEIRHISDNWTTGYVRLRIGPDGLVEDWIPLDLPHYKLIPAIDRALAAARFTPALSDGEPVAVDMPAEIPLNELNSYQVISESLAEHIESLQARMNPRQFQVVVSPPSELDDPLTLLAGSGGYQVVDENGALLSGQVIMSFYVDTKGKPRMIRVEEASDPGLIDAAFMTVEEFRFSPPARHRQPTVVRARIPVKFGGEG
jgi:TonB family protein